MKYAVKVMETLSKTVVVDADSLKDAIDSVEYAQQENGLDLDYSDYDGYRVTIDPKFPNGKIGDSDAASYPELNTRISYLYRDASNYKTHNEIIVSGVFTMNEITEILSCLDDGCYFIPEQVDFPVERFGSVTEDDHCWCELEESGFEIVDLRANSSMTKMDVLKAFREAKNNWQVFELLPF